MAKSTAMPTNSTANATDIRFSVPITKAAKAVVTSNPRIRVAMIGTISRQLRTARYSHNITSRKLPIRPATAPSATVANSSSSSTTWPVSRTRTSPCCT